MNLETTFKLYIYKAKLPFNPFLSFLFKDLSFFPHFLFLGTILVQISLKKDKSYSIFVKRMIATTMDTLQLSQSYKIAQPADSLSKFFYNLKVVHMNHRSGIVL